MTAVSRRGGSRGSGLLTALAIVVALCAAALAPAARAAVPTPEEDPFYAYTGTTPLAGIAPGTVLKTRTLTYHVVGLPLPGESRAAALPLDQRPDSANRPST